MCCKLMFFFWFGCGNAKIVPVTPRKKAFEISRKPFLLCGERYVRFA